MGPLAGLRALEIGDLGEVAGKILADAGVDLVKVEPPPGAGSRRTCPFVGDVPGANASLHFAYWNTSKRGITLDVSTADGAELWSRLVRSADIVIDSTPPGALNDLACGYGDFGDAGRLIWCSVTPFGVDGPWRDFAVTDLVSIALGGPMMSTGYEDHDLPPIRPDAWHSLAIGGEYAAVAILTALYQRQATGRGQLIDVSIHEAVSCTTEGAFPNWEYNRRISQRQTGRHASPTPTTRWQLRCADGNYVVLMGGGMPRDERVWNALMAWMEETGASEPIRHLDFKRRGQMSPEDRQLIFETIHRFVESLPAEEVYRRGQACHLPWGFVRRPEQNLDDPHWHDRGFFQKAPVPGFEGEVFYPGAPYRFGATPVAMRLRAPLLGEHNFEVFSAELGLSREQLVALAGAGVI
jgi:crotonobetainyl-CoA:carnitine CoA-transferase CaiB-like acyl-CoA transferase